MEQEKHKVKVIKAYTTSFDHYYGVDTVLYPASLDWEEVSEDELIELRSAVNAANAMRNDLSATYILISYHENLQVEVFRLASEFKEKIKQEEEKRKEKALREKQKREEKALERKRKQLEKLKKELEED